MYCEHTTLYMVLQTVYSAFTNIKVVNQTTFYALNVSISSKKEYFSLIFQTSAEFYFSGFPPHACGWLSSIFYYQSLSSSGVVEVVVDSGSNHSCAWVKMGRAAGLSSPRQHDERKAIVCTHTCRLWSHHLSPASSRLEASACFVWILFSLGGEQNLRREFWGLRDHLPERLRGICWAL